MAKTKQPPKKSLKPISDKDKKLYQLEATFYGFYSTPQTMKELSVRLNIDRANVCRYCRVFRLQHKLYVVSKKYCSITKHLANVYTTNESYKPSTGQLELFNNL
jgi:hypothetical protein